MENIDSETLLYIIAGLAAKFKQCKPNYKNYNERRSLKQKITLLYEQYLKLKDMEKKEKARKFRVREIFTEDQRLLQGNSNNLIEEMRSNDRKIFFNFLRMTPETFDLLLSKVESYLKKQDFLREAISPKTRLEITLRYLASGDTMVSLSYNFRVGKQTVSAIISECCSVIWNCLKDEVFIKPSSESWKEISDGFNTKWNFKNCIGAIDGKHVNIQAFPKSGSNYYNYKGSHSIILLAIADANYKFIMVDIGAEGRLSDSGVFSRSLMGQAFDQNSFEIPPSDGNLPYVLVGDEAFPLTKYLMRPYPRRGDLDLRKKVFNYRLSRARRIIENSFGLLVAKWRIFRKPINASESTVRKIVQACICLHNFLLIQKNQVENPTNQDVEELVTATEGLRDIARAGTNTFTRYAANIRENFADYFLNEGAVEWQWEKALNNDF